MVGLSDFQKRRNAELPATTVARNGRSRRPVEVDEVPIYDLVEIDSLRSNDYLVKGLIPRPGVTLIHSAPGVGKSFMALDLALSLGMGEKTWCGHRLATETRTLYVYSEGAGRLWKRRDAWLQRHGLELDSLRGRVQIIPRNLPLNRGRYDDEAFDELAKLMKAQKIGLLVIDTWATSNVGSDENSVRDVGIGLDRVIRLKEETGCAVVLVHHDNKTGGYRGSSAIDGVLDARLHLQRTGKQGDRTLKVMIEKQRDDAELVEWHARLDQVQLGLDDDGDPITSVVFTHVEEAEQAAKRVYDMAQVAQALWKFMQDTADDDDQDAWSKSDVIQKRHSSLIGTQKQKRLAIERMVERGVVLAQERRRLDALNRPIRYQRLVPLVSQDGAFSELLGALQDVEA